MDDERRKELWAAHALKHRVKSGKRREMVVRARTVRVETKAAVAPGVQLRELDRQLCEKCGRRGPVSPLMTRSPCCGARVRLGTASAQEALRLELWAKRIAALARASDG